MAWSFGDGFDLYAAVANMSTGYWDTASPLTNLGLGAGRFAGSQSIFQTNSNAVGLIKTSGVNDAVHHLAVAFKQTAAIGGSSMARYLQLQDGATAQCTIVFRSDGAICLTSGGAGGTVLATYTGAFPVTDTWYHFEFEVAINNTTGSFKVRKNGNSTDDFSLGSLNTRGGTANNYANRLQLGIGPTGVNSTALDDLFWKSDASSVAWLGDIRCHTRMPASDASVAFSRLSGATNFSNVDEAQQDALTSYVYSSTASQEDFYGVASIAVTPVTVIAVTTRGYMLKSDAGTRTAAAQLKSGATTVATPTLTLTTTGWQWAWRTDLTDPNTGSAWTAAAVNAAQVGPKVIA